MRTGLQTFARLIIQFCRLLDKYRLSIEAAINSLPLDASDKAKLLAALDTLDGACRIARAILWKLER